MMARLTRPQHFGRRPLCDGPCQLVVTVTDRLGRRRTRRKTRGEWRDEWMVEQYKAAMRGEAR
jgi:hypothetical protein